MHRPDLIEQFAREEHQRLLTQAHNERLLRPAGAAAREPQERRSFATRLVALLRTRTAV